MMVVQRPTFHAEILEEGKTKHPDRAWLAGIAALYDVPFELLVQRFVEANYGIEVRVQASGAGPSQETEVVDPTLARLTDLEARVAQYQSTLGELRDIVDRAGIAKARDEKESPNVTKDRSSNTASCRSI